MASTIVMILCPSPEGYMIIYLGNHVQGKGEYSFQKLGVNIDAWRTVSQFSVWSQLMVISIVPECIIGTRSWQNLNIHSLAFEVRIIIMGKAKWKPVALPPP